ncbi:MAG: pyruvate dehydrogenase [Planctomycetota bacterium]
MKSAPEPEFALIERIARRAFAHMVAMIHVANEREDADKTDPKVGGHPAACASSLDFLATLHLLVREPGDFVCCKPHASPVDHALHHALGLFRHHDSGEWFTEQESEAVMHRLRSFSHDGAPVFQSYHAEADPDSWRFLPSGSVGIPPVAAVYLSLAYRYARQHGWDIDEPHFWCMMGDSEFREGSLLEVLPEVAERELGNVTWIVDYNRQNLDGTRIPNQRGLKGTDADRIERTARANGWHVIQLRHGRFRQEVFAKKGGAALQKVLEDGLSDYQFQALLWKRDAAAMRDACIAADKACKPVVEALDDDQMVRLWYDLGGHDHQLIAQAFAECKQDKATPTLVVAHTVKGRGLRCVAANGNHSALPDQDEVEAILQAEGLSLDRPFQRLPADGDAGRYARQRGETMRLGIEALQTQAQANREQVAASIEQVGGVPRDLEINLKLAPITHTQWMWGQLAAKLVRIGVFDELQRAGKEHKAGKAPTEQEARWNPIADLMMTMAPDVGTSTNINPAMDEKIFGPRQENWEHKLDLHERLRPELAPTDEAWTRHIRFEIAEANCMSAVGSFGKMGWFAGIPFLPMMTVYDFFIKRALDQLYYDLYWNSSFILVGTPSGVTLAPEGAQHSWKSDIQIPNLITWEPAFAIEMEWILCDAIQRHFENDNKGRSGVLVRAVTRALHQDLLTKWLRRQAQFKTDLPADAQLGLTAQDGGLNEAEVPHRKDHEILPVVRAHALRGGYRLIDWRGYRGYQPGENVVNLFVMGALVPEAVAAAELLLDRGVYANVVVVTSPDLLCGELGRKDGFEHLTRTLGIDGALHLRPAGQRGGEVLGPGDVVDLAGRRVPVVSVHDGEIGLLDNLGSILGVRQQARAVVKFSKSGTPAHIYRYHGLHPEGIAEACGQALAETALEQVRLSGSALQLLGRQPEQAPTAWQELWPKPEQSPSSV